MVDKNDFSSLSTVLRLFQAQSILGFIGSTLPFDSKFDGFRLCLSDAMMSICKCTEVINDLYNESKNS